jgi:hypothetical protein
LSIKSLNHNFSTSDTALAAYLVSQGISEPEIEHTQNGCVFCFSDRNLDIQPYVFSYQTGTATGNIYIFYKNYKRLLNIVNKNKI